MGILRSAVASLLRPRDAPAKARDEPAADTSLAEARRLTEAGRLDAALAALDTLIATDPSSTAARLARASALRRWGREAEAAREIAAIEAQDAPTPELRRQRAWAAQREGRMADALPDLRALAADGNDREATVELAQALVALGRHDEARALLDAALARAPGEASLLMQAGANELARRRAADAETWFRRAVQAAPANARAHEHLGVALAALDRQREAVETLEAARVLAADDEIAGIAANIAIGHCELDATGRGIDVLLASLPTHPVLNGYLQLGPALLTQGRYREGWRQYEHRWLVEPLASMRADYGVPPWRGQPLDGRTILVRAEQGIGDVFQFMRYLPLLQARGARVLFQPLRGMDAIARRFPGVDHVVLEGERLPPFDYYANLMSLPDAFGTTLASIPADVPYFSPDPAYVAKWAPRLGAHDKPRVGLVWAGRPEHRQDRHRSFRLDALDRILALDGITFVSLQKGPAAVQAEAVPESVDWRAVGAELDDLDDLAAVLSGLDLLVCCDTGPAHLAAAMGKPVWILLPTPIDYRWLERREDSPWYPTIRLFRQRTSREWAPEIARLADALAQWRDAWRGPGHAAPPPTASAFPAADAPHEAPLRGIAVAADTRTGFLQFDPGERPVGESLDRYGEWAWPRLEVALRFTPPGATIVEAGGGAGAHTLALARAAGRRGLVLAYESRATLRRLLAGNLSAHALAQVSVMTRTLGAPADGGFDAAHETLDHLALARLDGLVVHERADALAILAGADATLWRCRPWLSLAADDAPTLARVREALRELGYRAWRLDTPLDPPGNYYRREPTHFGGGTAHALWALPEELDFRAELPGAVPWP